MDMIVTLENESPFNLQGVDLCTHANQSSKLLSMKSHTSNLQAFMQVEEHEQYIQS